MSETEMRLFDTPGDWFGRRFVDWSFPRWPDVWRTRVLDTTDVLRVEEFEDADALVVKAEMPGLDPDKDVDISVSDHTLEIHAHREQRTEEGERGRFHSEFRYGSFSRVIPLPEGTDDDAVQATYRDGILEVRVPIDRERSGARRIPVARG